MTHSLVVDGTLGQLVIIVVSRFEFNRVPSSRIFELGKSQMSSNECKEIYKIDHSVRVKLMYHFLKTRKILRVLTLSLLHISIVFLYVRQIIWIIKHKKCLRTNGDTFTQRLTLSHRSSLNILLEFEKIYSLI